MTVEEDQFTGEDDKSFGLVTVEGLVTTVEQLHELAGIAAGGRIFELTVGVEGNAGLSGVRDHETYLGLVGQCHEGGILGVRVQRTADDIDTLQGVYGLAVLTTLQVHMVETVLSIEPVDHSFLDRLYNND